MSDTMKVQPFEVLLTRMLTELERNDSIFGIPRRLFYVPRTDVPYITQDLFGQTLATPIGPAAGPHTQLAQNIICAWLCGGRFIELKTVQIMDDLEIPRPCIDMAATGDGYNVEWSQELKLSQSAEEYIKAWVLIHALRRLLGLEEMPLGTIFNMSVGYNLEGVQTPPMQRFMDRMRDASEEIAGLQSILARFPGLAGLAIPSQLTNSVTLSTMHGCPPDEIEQIAHYLLAERGLHTIVKLNPTLLGRDAVLRILHDDLGYHDIHIPEAVFEHDLQYDRAVRLIKALKQTALERGQFFGVKLSNTLAMANYRGVLPGAEMYMSGQALYPITVNLFHKLAQEFDGDLNVSYAGGADALNLTTLLAAGALPVTAASDLLKPGGYARFLHWLEELEGGMRARGASSLEELAKDRLTTVEAAAAQALEDPRYKKSYWPHGLPKVDTALDLFDCIAAPCMAQCAVCQDVPDYAWLIAQGNYDDALQVILQRNPLPGITGYVCTHLCQTRCTRNNYDQPVAIRALKRFAFEHGRPAGRQPALGHAQSGAGPAAQSRPQAPTVAIIGSGPAGLSAAYFLALSGVQATIFESREMPGGMPASAPRFRIPPEVVAADVERITRLGVDLRLNHPVAAAPGELLGKGFDAVYVATGFQQDAGLEIEGIEAKGVLTSLRFLEMVARGQRPKLGSKVLIIGGGNTAMDAARTAQRLTGHPSTIVYRRTLAEMPAEEEELAWLFEEGNQLLELASPRRVMVEDGHVVGLECVRNELGEPGPDGRRRPMAIAGSEFQIEADAIILAIGQKPDLAFLRAAGLTFRDDGAVATDPQSRRTAAERVYAGGDVTRGPAIIIQACEDGRRAAMAICEQLGTSWVQPMASRPELSPDDILRVKYERARRVARHEAEMLPVARRAGFDCVEQTLSEAAARGEARRCLQCATFCDKCVEVCPNRANYTYLVEPVGWTLPVLACQGGELVVAGWESFRVEQARQILHVDDFCNECGNCATFCVHQGKPYADKPRLFLEEAGFRLEDDNAFYIQAGTIRRRAAGRESRLSLQDGGLVFENAHVRLGLLPNWEIGQAEVREPFEGVLSLQDAAEMAVILKGVGASLPFLLPTR
jgi:putative selenate reductase